MWHEEHWQTFHLICSQVCVAQSELGNIVYTWLKNGRPFHLDGEAGQQVFRESPFDGNIIFVSPGKILNQRAEIHKNLIFTVFSVLSVFSIKKPDSQGQR